ncbi:MAG TPA: hypothetical protein VMU50_19280 [Polyangia bacterium]|nr:hypothetical protein [Polyangia bacterium]
MIGRASSAGAAPSLPCAARSAIATVVVAAAVIAGAAGCHEAPPAARPTPGPAAAELREALSARQAAVRSMNARVRATSWIGGDRLRASVLMLVTRAGQLRFEAEVSLQGTVSILATDGERFALLDLQKNQLRRGPACPANVASLIRIPLAPSEVAAILLGDVELPAGAGGGCDRVSWDGARGADVLSCSDGGGGRTLLSFQEHGRDRDLVAVVREDARGARLWQTAYDDLRSVSTVRLPAVIRFAEGTASFDQGVEVKFKDVTINGPPRPEDFTLNAPPGVTVLDQPCPS